ncbi:MAG: bifunctional DNA-formamidopyrimidine glycosylase/DNA-(apurinic or apyrimidinic site) lyase [Patescibacteria group bacterium]
MPELPEVQTVVAQLDRKIVGKTIGGFWSDWKRKIFPSYAVFAKQVKGAKVRAVRRLGKHIVIDLGNSYSIVAHFKMTGHFLVKNRRNRESPAFTEDKTNGYIHHIVAFADGTTLEFSDMRKFGWLCAVKTSEVETLPSIASLGIDALSPTLTQRRFQELFSGKKKRPIGVALLEQHLIAGIGNIYRNEALYLAGILPMRHAGTLARNEWEKLLSAIKRVLRKAVRLRGTSDGDFRDTDGLQGGFQRTLYVYARTGEPCRKCGTMIVRKKIGQRSVFYCPRCQQ